MIQNIRLISLILITVMIGCGEAMIDVPTIPAPLVKRWNEISEFKNADIRYMVQHDGFLYVSTHVLLQSKDSTNRLYRTEDGVVWEVMKIFERFIGPIAFLGDTLTLLEDGRTWKYHPTFGWKMFWQHLMTASFARDMFWINKELFIYENAFRQALFIDSVRDLYDPPYISKCVKHFYHGKEVIYTRPFHIYKDEIYRFDGQTYETLMNGIDTKENQNANYPSLVIHDDTLYAGFNTPCRIKKLTNDTWVNVTDTIANMQYVDLFSSPLKNRPTSIVFHKNRMFVGTEWTGVLEWTDSGWVGISNGLQLAFPDYPEYLLYTAVIQIESFNNKLFVAYGEPWFAPIAGGHSMYSYDIE